jgi:hypothetical protein
LAVAKNEKELLLWIEQDRQIRETYRDKEETDYHGLVMLLSAVPKNSYASHA